MLEKQFECTIGDTCPYQLCIGDNCEYHKTVYKKVGKGSAKKKRMDQYKDRKYCSADRCSKRICTGMRCGSYIHWKDRD